MSQRSPISLYTLSKIILLCFAAAFLLSLTPFIQQLGWQSLDLRTQVRTHFQDPPDPRFAMVLYEDTSNARTDIELGPWPLDRKWHAELLKLLNAAEPAVIAWDVIFDADGKTPEGDQVMAEIAGAVSEAGIPVLSAAVTSDDASASLPEKGGHTRPFTRVKGDIKLLKAGDKRAFLPFKALRDSTTFAFADTPPGPDGIRRRIPLLVRFADEVHPTLSLQTVLSYLKVKPEEVEIVLGKYIRFSSSGRAWTIPIGKDGTFWLNFRYTHEGSARRAMPTYPYVDLLLGLNAKFVEEKKDAGVPDLKGRILFIGQTVTGMADAGPNPLQGYAPLTLFIANTAHAILHQDYVHEIPDWLTWLGTALGAFLLFLYSTRKSARWLILATLITLLLHAAICTVLWITASVWLLWIGPSLGMASSGFAVIGIRYRQEMLAKEKIKNMFGSYLSPVIVTQLVQSGKEPQLGGHNAEITPYFSDIQNFSSFSEVMSASQLTDLLNEYLSACTDIIQAEGGTLDKYIGDAVVAMYGTPVELEDHALRACVASQLVHRKLAELREKWKSEGDRWPELVHKMQTRIGLNTGMCMIGNMGSRTRFNYTMMGDNVNLAARMESGAKGWGVYTMCTETTRNSCEKCGPGRLVFRPLGRIVVKGRSQAVPIHEIVGLKEDLSQQTRECLGLFAQGMDKMYAQDWDAAQKFFTASSSLEPKQPGRDPGVKSNASLVRLQWVEHYRMTPPPGDWDGVEVMTEK